MILTKENIQDVCIKGNAQEAETVINFGRYDDYAEVYTTDNTILTEMKKCISNVEWEIKKYTCNADGSISSITFQCPKEFISFRKKHKTMSDEQVEKAKERMKNMWKNKEK